MKKWSLLFSLLAVFAATASAEDSIAWSDTRWGMSIPDVQRLYPAAAPTGESATNRAKLALTGFKIGSASYTVRFFFDSSRQLSEVSLSLEHEGKSIDDVLAKNAAEFLKEELIRKYGQPSVEKGDMQRTLWNGSKLVVAMTYSPMFNDVHVSYSKSDTQTLGKL